MIEEVVKKLDVLLQGEIPEKIAVKQGEDQAKIELSERLNQLFAFIQESQEAMAPLAQGDLSRAAITSHNFLASPYKELHSRLLHLLWQTEQVAKGDYKQRVDFMGDFSRSFNAMVEALEFKDNLLKNRIVELETTLANLTSLEAIIPVCSGCKKIRQKDGDPFDQRSWMAFEAYFTSKTGSRFSHGICPDCLKEHYLR